MVERSKFTITKSFLIEFQKGLAMKTKTKKSITNNIIHDEILVLTIFEF